MLPDIRNMYLSFGPAYKHITSQRFLLLITLLGCCLMFAGRGVQWYKQPASIGFHPMERTPVLSKYFTHARNVSMIQIVSALSMEQKLLRFELNRLHELIRKQRKRLEIWRDPQRARPRSPTEHQEAQAKKVVPTLRSVQKLFVNLHDMVSGAIVESQSVTESASVLTPYDFKQRQEESAVINRLLAAKMTEISAVHNKWREEAAYSAEDDFQTRLYKLQNPESCSSAKKLVCDMDREGCGLGCQLHYGVTCIAASFALNRTTILRLGNWIYTKGLTNRWEDYFVPPSPKCQWTPYSEPLTVWRNASHNALNTVLYPLDVFNVQYFKPFRVAESFADRLRHFHGRPWIWWIGQLLVNLFRVQTDFEDLFAKRAKAIGFKSPIVGVHVRRSDKTASEARAYDLEAYMALVEEYYDRLELTQKVDQRRVFLASDAPSVYVEFRMKYPQYALVHNQAAAKSSARKETRRSEDSLRGIMADMYFLAKTDHLVCTMSSNVCRIVYAVLQTRFPDATRRYDSVDIEYIYMGSNPLYHKAVHPNEAGVNGISLGFNVGDRIRVKDTYWNGTSYGLIVQQNGSWVEDKGQRGSFPAYKLQEDLEVF